MLTSLSRFVSPCLLPSSFCTPPPSPVPPPSPPRVRRWQQLGLLSWCVWLRGGKRFRRFDVSVCWKGFRLGQIVLHDTREKVPAVF